MAAPSDYRDIVDLKALADGGLVNEDVAQEVYKLKQLDTPVLNRIGRSVATSSTHEWTEEDIQTASDTKIVSGSDLSSYSAVDGRRVRNYTQINRIGVATTGRLRAVDVIGRSDETAYQSMRASEKLKLDIERQILGAQASVNDDNNATAGVSGGLSAWIATNDAFGSGGASGGYNTSTSVVDAPTRGIGAVMTQALWDTAVLDTYNQGSKVSLMVTTPTLVTKINTFLVGGTGAKRATPSAQVNGASPVVNQSAQGHFSFIVTDFGTVLEIIPDIYQPTASGGGGSDHSVTVADVFLLNPEYLAVAFLRGFRVEPVAKLGDSDRAQALVDWTLEVRNEKAQAVVRDRLPSGTVTA
jgi:hypothetical protein